MAKKPSKMPKRNKELPLQKSGAGMTKAGVAAYNRANPGSKLKPLLLVK